MIAIQSKLIAIQSLIQLLIFKTIQKINFPGNGIIPGIGIFPNFGIIGFGFSWVFCPFVENLHNKP